MTGNLFRPLLLLAAAVGFLPAPLARAQVMDVPRTSKEVRFPSAPDTILAGTLERPRSSATRRPPVAVIVPGTGPWTRGGFEKMRARLLSSGIAVLQYDKRGQGKSTGAFVDTLPAMEQDVAASIAYLRTRRDLDPDRVVLIGHSQGAVAVPAVASRDPRIRAVVMLSGPVGPRGELFLTILRANLASGGKSPSEIERVASAVSSWMDARLSMAGPATIAEQRAALVRAFAAIGLAEGAVQVLDNDVVLSMYAAAPAEALSRIRAPVLAVYGSGDEVIAPGPAAAAAVNVLKANPESLVVTVPGVDHVLAVPQAARAAAELSGPDFMVPSVVDVVGAWLVGRVGPAEAASRTGL